MRKLRKILTTGLMFSALLVPKNLPSSIIEQNRLYDVNSAVSEQSITYSFEMSKKPLFVMEPSGEKGISLSFPNTNKPDELKTKIDKTPFIHLDNAGASKNTGFILTPENPYGKIKCAWIDDRSIFIVNIEINPDDEGISDIHKEHALIKDIRIGFKENAARVVIGSATEPQWGIRYNSSGMQLLLDASSEDIKTKSYSSNKWLRQVEVNEKDNKSTELSLDLESEPDQIDIFWMSFGKRLVLDVLQNPDSRITALLDGKINDENARAVTAEKSDNDSKNIVRMKIGKEETVSASSSGQEKKETKLAAAVPEIQTDIKPLLKRKLPGSEDIDVDVDKLSPEEAFLFGRIRQAKEINDYDTGIALSSQFLNKYQKSGLCEEISFWRGDFYYNQWEKGDKEAGEKAILAYKNAIERFENSRNIPLSYIKMARVAAGMDDGFQALGYLSIVISGKNSDYMPLAYLTRGKVFLQIDQPDKAINDFKVLLRDYSGSHDAMEASLWIASYYHKIGLYEQAEQKLTEIDEKHPGLYLEYPEFILLNAKNDLYLKKYAEARKYLFKALNIGSQKETIDMLLSRIGDTYHNEGNNKEAEKYYRMVIDYYPESEGASISKLRLAEYFSDITILDNLSQNKSNESIGELAILEKAYQLFENKEYAETIKTLKEIVNKPVQTETRKDAKRLFVHAIEKEMDRLKGIGLYKDLVYLYEENADSLADRINPEALLMVAEAYKKLGRQMDAISTYQQIKSYDLSPDKRGSYIQGLADSYNSMDETDKAISLLEKGRNEKMKSADLQKIYLLLADLYKLKGRNKDAENLYSLVIQDIKSLPPEDAAQAYLNLGITYKTRKKFGEARNAFNHSIDISLENHLGHDTLQSAYIELGNVLYAESRFHEATRAFEKGFENGFDSGDPEYWETRFRQAMAYMKTGEESKAETLFNDITEGGGDSILQQRAQLKLGSIALAKQLKILSMGEHR